MSTRVAVAEIRTAVYRAFVAAGASTGEADEVADACTIAEVDDAGGVQLAVAGLSRVPRGRVGAVVEAGVPARLRDPASRATILQVRMALDWLGAHPGQAIALAGAVGATALGGALPAGGVAVEFAAGEPSGGCAVTPGGDLLRFTGAPDCSVPPCADGIVMLLATPTVGTLLRTAERHRRWLAACADGICVDQQAWRTLTLAAQSYLVPEV